MNKFGAYKNKILLCNITSYLFMAFAFVVCIQHGLLGALLAGTLVYSLVTIFSPRLEVHVGNNRGRIVMVGIIGTIIVSILTFTTWGAIAFIKSENGNAQILLQKLADIIDASRAQCPEWICSKIPDSALELNNVLSTWIREHANEAQMLGADAGHTFIRILIGMIIGAMVSLHLQPLSTQPLVVALVERISIYNDAFKKIVFAQVKISAINATFTGMYILIVLPLAGIDLPLAKTLILLTFIFGLVPILGNLMSNTMLVFVTLPFGLMPAAASLLFLVVLHKLEYFLNAKIIGSQIKSYAWELLIAMLVMESIFGLVGVVIAPILYAYTKQELVRARLI